MLACLIVDGLNGQMTCIFPPELRNPNDLPQHPLGSSAVVTIPLTVRNVVVNDSRKQFGFDRKALIDPLLYLEQQLSTEANCLFCIGGLERTPYVFSCGSATSGVEESRSPENYELAVLKIPGAFHPRWPWLSPITAYPAGNR
jgi:hypothetical protein